MPERKDNSPVQVRLTEQERKQLKAAADRLGVNQSDLVRIALNNLFEQYSVKQQLAMRQTSKKIPHVI
jgi:antitoxin component of RelBE/YafQ-DinJ toxin-antitoxin module